MPATDFQAPGCELNAELGTAAHRSVALSHGTVEGQGEQAVSHERDVGRDGPLPPAPENGEGRLRYPGNGEATKNSVRTEAPTHELAEAHRGATTGGSASQEQRPAADGAVVPVNGAAVHEDGNGSARGGDSARADAEKFMHGANGGASGSAGGQQQAARPDDRERVAGTGIAEQPAATSQPNGTAADEDAVAHEKHHAAEEQGRGPGNTDSGEARPHPPADAVTSPARVAGGKAEAGNGTLQELLPAQQQSEGGEGQELPAGGTDAPGTPVAAKPEGSEERMDVDDAAGADSGAPHSQRSNSAGPRVKAETPCRSEAPVPEQERMSGASPEAPQGGSVKAEPSAVSSEKQARESGGHEAVDSMGGDENARQASPEPSAGASAPQSEDGDEAEDDEEEARKAQEAAAKNAALVRIVRLARGEGIAPGRQRQQFVDAITERNRALVARTHEASLRRIGTKLETHIAAQHPGAERPAQADVPLYKKPAEVPGFARLFASYKAVKPALQQLLQQRRDKWRGLQRDAALRYRVMAARLNQVRGQEAPATVLAPEEGRTPASAGRRGKDRGRGRNATAAAVPGPEETPSAPVTGALADYRNEAMWEARMLDAERNKVYCPLPEMLGPDDLKRNCYISRNGLFDPREELRRAKLHRPWSEKERKTLLERFSQHPKDFNKIAAALPGRTANECIVYFYTHQKKDPKFAEIRAKQKARKLRKIGNIVGRGGIAGSSMQNARRGLGKRGMHAASTGDMQGAAAPSLRPASAPLTQVSTALADPHQPPMVTDGAQEAIRAAQAQALAAQQLAGAVPTNPLLMLGAFPFTVASLLERQQLASVMAQPQGLWPGAPDQRAGWADQNLQQNLQHNLQQLQVQMLLEAGRSGGPQQQEILRYLGLLAGQNIMPDAGQSHGQPGGTAGGQMQGAAPFPGAQHTQQDGSGGAI
ncbi:unnamed protein product [Pedinophyceae sp. YPF-701]|nr:unnamed protein product [Pedinophyceae sp. YPF-701]